MLNEEKEQDVVVVENEVDSNDIGSSLYGFIDKRELRNNMANAITIKMIMARNLQKMTEMGNLVICNWSCN